MIAIFVTLTIFLSYKLWKNTRFNLQLIKLLMKYQTPVKPTVVWHVDGNSFDEDWHTDQGEIFSPNPFYESSDTLQQAQVLENGLRQGDPSALQEAHSREAIYIDKQDWWPDLTIAANHKLTLHTNTKCEVQEWKRNIELRQPC